MATAVLVLFVAELFAPAVALAAQAAPALWVQVGAKRVNLNSTSPKVRAANLTALQQIQGIGPKTAARIVNGAPYKTLADVGQGISKPAFQNLRANRIQTATVKKPTAKRAAPQPKAKVPTLQPKKPATQPRAPPKKAAVASKPAAPKAQPAPKPVEIPVKGPKGVRPVDLNTANPSNLGRSLLRQGYPPEMANAVLRARKAAGGSFTNSQVASRLIGRALGQPVSLQGGTMSIPPSIQARLRAAEQLKVEQAAAKARVRQRASQSANQTKAATQAGAKVIRPATPGTLKVSNGQLYLEFHNGARLNRVNLNGYGPTQLRLKLIEAGMGHNQALEVARARLGQNGGAFRSPADLMARAPNAAKALKPVAGQLNVETAAAKRAGAPAAKPKPSTQQQAKADAAKARQANLERAKVELQQVQKQTVSEFNKPQVDQGYKGANARARRLKSLYDQMWKAHKKVGRLSGRPVNDATLRQMADFKHIETEIAKEQGRVKQLVETKNAKLKLKNDVQQLRQRSGQVSDPVKLRQIRAELARTLNNAGKLATPAETRSIQELDARIQKAEARANAPKAPKPANQNQAGKQTASRKAPGSNQGQAGRASRGGKPGAPSGKATDLSLEGLRGKPNQAALKARLQQIDAEIGQARKAGDVARVKNLQRSRASTQWLQESMKSQRVQQAKAKGQVEQAAKRTARLEARAAKGAGPKGSPLDLQKVQTQVQRSNGNFNRAAAELAKQLPNEYKGGQNEVVRRARAGEKGPGLNRIRTLDSQLSAQRTLLKNLRKPGVAEQVQAAKQARAPKAPAAPETAKGSAQPAPGAKGPSSQPSARAGRTPTAKAYESVVQHAKRVYLQNPRQWGSTQNVMRRIVTNRNVPPELYPARSAYTQYLQLKAQEAGAAGAKPAAESATSGKRGATETASRGGGKPAAPSGRAEAGAKGLPNGKAYDPVWQRAERVYRGNRNVYKNAADVMSRAMNGQEGPGVQRVRNHIESLGGKTKAPAAPETASTRGGNQGAKSGGRAAPKAPVADGTVRGQIESVNRALGQEVARIHKASGGEFTSQNEVMRQVRQGTSDPRMKEASNLYRRMKDLQAQKSVKGAEAKADTIERAAGRKGKGGNASATESRAASEPAGKGSAPGGQPAAPEGRMAQLRGEYNQAMQKALETGKFKNAGEVYLKAKRGGLGMTPELAEVNRISNEIAQMRGRSTSQAPSTKAINESGTVPERFVREMGWDTPKNELARAEAKAKAAGAEPVEAKWSWKKIWTESTTANSQPKSWSESLYGENGRGFGRSGGAEGGGKGAAVETATQGAKAVDSQGSFRSMFEWGKTPAAEVAPAPEAVKPGAEVVEAKSGWRNVLEFGRGAEVVDPVTRQGVAEPIEAVETAGRRGVVEPVEAIETAGRRGGSLDFLDLYGRRAVAEPVEVAGRNTAAEYAETGVRPTEVAPKGRGFYGEMVENLGWSNRGGTAQPAEMAVESGRLGGRGVAEYAPELYEMANRRAGVEPVEAFETAGRRGVVEPIEAVETAGRRAAVEPVEAIETAGRKGGVFGEGVTSRAQWWEYTKAQQGLSPEVSGMKGNPEAVEAAKTSRWNWSQEGMRFGESGKAVETARGVEAVRASAEAPVAETAGKSWVDQYIQRGGKAPIEAPLEVGNRVVDPTVELQSTRTKAPAEVIEAELLARNRAALEAKANTVDPVNEMLGRNRASVEVAEVRPGEAARVTETVNSRGIEVVRPGEAFELTSRHRVPGEVVETGPRAPQSQSNLKLAEAAAEVVPQRTAEINGRLYEIRGTIREISRAAVETGQAKTPAEALELASKPGAKSGAIAELAEVKAEAQNLQTRKGELVEAQQVQAKKAVVEAVRPAEAGKAVETAGKAIETGRVVETAGKPVETAGKVVETARGVEVVGAKGAPAAPANALGLNGPLPGAYEVQFGKTIADVAKLTPRQIVAESGGMISMEGATKLAEVAAKNGGSLSATQVREAGLKAADVQALETAGKAAASTRVTQAQTRVNAQADALVQAGKYPNRAAALQGAELKGVSESLAKAQEGTGSRAASEPATPKAENAARSFDAGKPVEYHAAKAAEYSAQIEAVKAESGKGIFGRIKRFTNAKKIQALEAQKAFHEQKASELKGADPAALKSESAKLEMTAHQAKLHGALKAELAKVDPNSRYGKALQQRIEQLESTPGENFAKSAAHLVAISIGTNLFFNIWRQIKQDGKVDIGKAAEFLATKEFWMSTGGLVGGVFVGQKIAGMAFYELLATRVTGMTALGGTFVRLFPAFALGAVGATLLGGHAGDADWGLVGAQTIGSTLGTAIAISMLAAGPIGQLVGALVGGFIAEKVLEMIRGEGPEADAAAREDPAATGGDGEAAGGGVSGYADGAFTTEDVELVFEQMKASYDAYKGLEEAGKYAEAAEAFETYIGLKRQLDSMRQTAFAARR